MNAYSGYTIKWVTLPWERRQAYELRQRVFCQEQGLFSGNDLDDIDEHAHLLVALGSNGGWHEEVVGTVRIHQLSPEVWMGSRLAVDHRYRRQGQLGPTLIRLAVCSAHALGCQAFYAGFSIRMSRCFVGCTGKRWTGWNCVVLGMPVCRLI